MDTLWAFAGYTFPADSLPSDGGDWDEEEKLVEHEPLMANETVFTSLGFKSRSRTIAGDCSRDFRDTMKLVWRNTTVGTLTDGEGRAVAARVTSARFKPLANNYRFRYSITFRSRGE